MKQLFYTLITLFVLASCGSSKIDYLAHSNDDKTLFDAVKIISRFPSDTSAAKALPILYPLAQQRHLAKIATYKNETALSARDKTIEEYTILQKMYDAISGSDNASRLVAAVNYQVDLINSKQEAAEAYYQQATNFMATPGRDNAKAAWTYFKKADNWVPGYKDAKAKMEEAYQSAVVNVVIYPVQDNSFYFSTGLNNGGYPNSNEYFQQNLVRELGDNARRYPARFYSEWDARRHNIKADWVVDLTLRNLDVPRPYGTSYTRNASQAIEDGRDSSGHPIYRTVYATVNITRASLTARGQMDVDITEAGTRRNISSRSYNEEYRWQEEYADYNGDSRALSAADWQLVNNNSHINNQPSKEEVLNELYRRIYPQVKSAIIYSVDW